jgi:reactive intermediate/imine deaminase
MACCHTPTAHPLDNEAEDFCLVSRYKFEDQFHSTKRRSIMSIKRYGVEGGKGTGGQHLPFARAVEANGWLYVSGQVSMVKGEVVGESIIAQSHQAIRNVLSILEEAGYGLEHVVRCGVWLDDPRDFHSFNGVFREYFGENPPARACVVSSMVVDCKVEIDCVAYKAPVS